MAAPVSVKRLDPRARLSACGSSHAVRGGPMAYLRDHGSVPQAAEDSGRIVQLLIVPYLTAGRGDFGPAGNR